MPCTSPFIIALSYSEERILIETSRKYTAPYYKVVRAKIVLFAASGLDNERISEILDVPRRVVTKWRKRFYYDGIDGLEDQPRCGRPHSFSPQSIVEIKALACELPSTLGLPFSRLSNADIAREAVVRGVVISISVATVWRCLHRDAIKPWMHHSWLFPRDPLFAEKAARVLDLYFRVFDAIPFGPDDYVISADEKTSIQARHRKTIGIGPMPYLPRRVEFEYERKGALAYLAAWDVHRAKLFGICEKTTGIDAYRKLVDLVMQQEPYRSARRVFWITDNGSSHRGESSVQRLSEWHPNAIQIHTPIHASWLNQIEIFFSVLQRKVLTPNDFPDLQSLEMAVIGFQALYNKIAKPFKWKYTKDDLKKTLSRIHTQETTTDHNLLAA